MSYGEQSDRNPFTYNPWADEAGNIPDESNQTPSEGRDRPDPFNANPFEPEAIDPDVNYPSQTDDAGRQSQQSGDLADTPDDECVSIRRDPFEGELCTEEDFESLRRAAGSSNNRDQGQVEATLECDAFRQTQLEVVSVEITEELNQPYSIDVRLHSEQRVEPAMLLGTDCHLCLGRGSQEERFHGLAAEVLEGVADNDDLTFRLRIVPALQMLSLRRDTRIFQDKTVPEILETVLGPTLSPFQRELRLELRREPYPTCEYRVQYDETDLDFVHRLMEEEGIVYRFVHSGPRETLVLTDDVESFDDIDHPDGPTVIMTGFASSSDNRQTIRAFHRRSAMRSTRLAACHWDWTHANLVENELAGEPPDEADPPDGASSGPEREEYHHEHHPLTFSDYSQAQRCYQANDSLDQVRLRRELQARDARVGEGLGTVLALRPGGSFELEGHDQSELDGAYRLTWVQHRYLVSEGESQDRYSNRFGCLPREIAFRPERHTTKPRIRGLLTATVVGPAGEEVHTDEHGRIKVQFHWDRIGVLDELSSCWIRVMQPWAGEGWGFLFLPRIGMEVTVSFLDGDPDHPLITGAVYNGDNTTPYPLPDEKTRSVIRTRSSLGGEPDQYNELSFEDRLGGEEVYLQAQRDLRELVKHNHSTTVRGDQTNSVGGNQNESVGHDQAMSVDNNRTVHIGGSQSVTIDGGAAVDGITGSKLTITGDYKVDASNTIEIQAPTHIKLTCGGSSILIEPNQITLTAGNRSYLVLDTDASMVSSQGSVVALSANADLSSSRGGHVFLDANATVASNAGSRLRLDTIAAMAAADGGRVRLYGDALLESSNGAKVLLNTDASVNGTIATVEGSFNAKLKSGSSSVTCDSICVAVDGPKVLLNS